MPRTNTKKNNIEQKEEEDERVANYIITTNPKYKNIELPNMIKIKDPFPGEVPIWVKRGFPKAARIHKKREEKDSHKFFLSELMLYTGWTDEKQLGSHDEEKCRKLYIFFCFK